MSQYSRTQKSNNNPKEIPVKQIKTGFSALQKTLALMATVLSIIVASITITRFLNENKTDSSDPSSTVIYLDNGQTILETTSQTAIWDNLFKQEQTSEIVTEAVVETSVAETTIVTETTVAETPIETTTTP